MNSSSTSLDPIFHSWSFVPIKEQHRAAPDDVAIVGTCVEGIAVEFKPPGFAEMFGIVALANATGELAPKTNVARSSLENTSESRELKRGIYRIFAAQIDEETKRLVRDERFSLSRAMNEIEYLTRPFFDEESPVADSDLMEEVFSELPVFLMENDTERCAVSLGELKRRGAFWSIVSPLNWSIEYLIREMPVSVTARQIFGLAKEHISTIPNEIIISNLNSASMSLGFVEQQFEVRELRASEKDRRVDLKWTVKGQDEAWINGRAATDRLRRLDYRLWSSIFMHFRDSSRLYSNYYVELGNALNIMFPVGEIVCQGLQDYGAVRAFGNMYLCPGHVISNYLVPLIRSNSPNELARCMIYLNTLNSITASPRESINRSVLDQRLRELRVRNWDDYVEDWSEFCGALAASSLRVFDPLAWSRGKGEY